jgi:hypothetical protein
MARLNEKVELETGVPLTVAFAYETGRFCSKRWPGAEDTLRSADKRWARIVRRFGGGDAPP